MNTTKYNRPEVLASGQVNPIINLFFEFAQLKNLFRKGWMEVGVPEKDCESVADHSFMSALLAYIITEQYRPDLDAQKVMMIELFHELGKIHLGDVTPSDNVSEQKEIEAGRETITKVFAGLPNAQKYIDLWTESVKEETAESKFARQVDILEMTLQASFYEKMKYPNQTIEEFFSYAKEKLTAPELKPILEDILGRR